MRINHYLICISVIIILYFISLNPVLAGGSNEIPVDECIELHTECIQGGCNSTTIDSESWILLEKI